jgi:hypothetical protein
MREKVVRVQHRTLLLIRRRCSVSDFACTRVRQSVFVRVRKCHIQAKTQQNAPHVQKKPEALIHRRNFTHLHGRLAKRLSGGDFKKM